MARLLFDGLVEYEDGEWMELKIFKFLKFNKN